MKASDCSHLPKEVLSPRAETGHQTMASYPESDNSFRWCYEHNDYLE